MEQELSKRECSEVFQQQEYVEHKVSHQRQRFEWDCGVACVLMLLPPEQRQELLTNFELVCREEGFHQCTWTIDLCYLLKRFGIEHSMYTTMLGVNEGHKRNRYYDKILDSNRERVRRRFAEAASAGLAVVQGSLTDGELVRHVSERGPALLLVDAGLLACDLCKRNKLHSEIRRCFGGGYRGHYIVVVGVSGGRVLYRDPALPARLCACPPRALRPARRAPGTDHDAILVHKDYR